MFLLSERFWMIEMCGTINPPFKLQPKSPPLATFSVKRIEISIFVVTSVDHPRLRPGFWNCLPHLHNRSNSHHNNSHPHIQHSEKHKIKQKQRKPKNLLIGLKFEIFMVILQYFTPDFAKKKLHQLRSQKSNKLKFCKFYLIKLIVYGMV